MTNRSVLRAAQILELLAQCRRGMTLSEVSSAMQAPLSSIRDLLSGLVATGFVERRNTAYVLGPMPFVLSLYSETAPAALVSHRDLENLAAEGGFTVVLAIRIVDELVIIDEAGGHPLLKHRARTRARIDMLSGIVGRTYLAALDDNELYEFLRSHRCQEQVNEFLREVLEIREAGVSVGVAHGIAPREGHPGTDTGVISVVLRDHHDRPCGVVVIGQDPEYVDEHRDWMVDVLLRHTKHWSERLGSVRETSSKIENAHSRRPKSS